MSSKRKEEKQDDQQATFLAKSTFVVWAVGGLAFLGLLYWVTPRTVVAFAALRVEAPTVGQWMLSLGAEIRTMQGLGIAVGVWALTLLPFVVGARRGGGSKLYGTLALIAFCAIGLLWFSTVQPAELVAQGALPWAK